MVGACDVRGKMFKSTKALFLGRVQLNYGWRSLEAVLEILGAFAELFVA